MDNKINYIPNRKEITNQRQQNFLAENGVFPLYTKGNKAYYEKTKKLNDLLDLYFIRAEIFRARY